MDKQKLIEQWEELNPQTKRTAVLGVLAVVVIGMMYIYVTSGEQTGTQESREQVELRTPLTASDDSMLGIDSLANRVRELQNEVENERQQRRQEVQRAQEELQRLRRQAIRDQRELSSELRSMVDQQRDLTNKLKELEQNPPAAAPTENPEPTPQQDESSEQENLSGDPAPVVGNEWDMFSGDIAANIPISEGGTTDARGETGDQAPAPPKSVSIRQIGDIKEPEEIAAEREENVPTKGVSLPSGSMITGVLITGMDAPTGGQARSTPFPALIRVTNMAILPNLYDMDVRECFILGSGYGDLSTERAYIRAERISCINADGQSVDTQLDAFAAGEDSKAGLRGRVVTRMGAALANSAIAGFAAGASQIFSPQSVPVISSDAANPVTQFSGAQAASAAGRGASEALTKISDYYLSLADQTFPVIEIDAARAVTFVLVNPLNVEVPLT